MGARIHLKRVDRILEVAHTHRVQVVLARHPYMANVMLDGQMRYLEQLLSGTFGRQNYPDSYLGHLTAGLVLLHGPLPWLVGSLWATAARRG